MTKPTGRPRGRPPTSGARLGRLYVNIPAPIIAALTAEADRRGVSLSALTRAALATWLDQAGIAYENGDSRTEGEQPDGG